MSAVPNPTFLPDEFRSLLLEGAEEVLGQEEARGLFLRAQAQAENEAEGGFSRELVLLHKVMEDTYGPVVTQGLAQRVGRAGFRKGLKRWGDEVGLMDVSFRLLPTGKRIYKGLSYVAESLAAKAGLVVRVDRTDRHWTMRIEHESLGAAPLCHWVTGTLQEFASWAGNGRVYQVREVECSQAGGDSCLFAIDMKPLD